MLKKHYQILGLTRKATKNQIKKAYRKKAMFYHPDRNSSPAAEQKFIDINISYEILMDYIEGGSPTYTQISQEDYKKTTYYQNTRFTIAEMEEAWAKQRAKARKKYEDYLSLPWYSLAKLGEYFLHGFVGVVFLTIVVPLFLAGVFIIIVSKEWLAPGVILISFSLFGGYSLYSMYKR